MFCFLAELGRNRFFPSHESFLNFKCCKLHVDTVDTISYMSSRDTDTKFSNSLAKLIIKELEFIELKEPEFTLSCTLRNHLSLNNNRMPKLPKYYSLSLFGWLPVSL